MLRLKLLDRYLCLIHVYGLKSSALQPEFVEEINDPLRKVKTNESMILLLGYGRALGYGCDWPNGDVDVNADGKLLLLCVAFWKGTERLANWDDHPHTHVKETGENAPTTGVSLSLASLEKCMPSALKKDAAK